MKLVHQDFSRPIFEEKDDFVELIIESPECFGAYISELAEQCKGQEGRYVLSDKEKEVDLAKNVEIIFDIFSLEINEKRILNKLYSEMNELAKSEEFFVKTQEVIQGIQKYLLDLEYATDYILTFEQEIELPALFKAAGLRHEEIEENYFERIIRYVKIVVSILHIRVLVFVNLRSYLTDEQIQELMEEALRQQIYVVLVENSQKNCIEGGKRYILEKLGYNEHTVELAQIAGYMHDMGNCVNRVDHAHSSALMAFQLLREWKVPDEDIAAIVSAIGQHDEKTGTAVDAVSAALILADKTDVRRNRVRNPIKETFDIHDRVNYAAVASSLQVNVEKKVILLEIELDEEICSILDYFEIFLQRMLMCKRAAEILGLKFKMKANGNKIC